MCYNYTTIYTIKEFIMRLLNHKTALWLCLIAISSLAVANHKFTVCYHNNTANSVLYDNDGITHKWKNRGQLVGSGELATGATKCFGNIVDETIFSTDYLTFSIEEKLNNVSKTRWIGIANSGFSRPYIVAQDAKSTKNGKLVDHKVDGNDNYVLHVFLQPDGSIVYSNVDSVTDTSAQITPRLLK